MLADDDECMGERYRGSTEQGWKGVTHNVI